MKRACVIGWPVSHSLSPVIHGYWLKEHGLEGEYVKQPVEPKDFESFLTSLPVHGFCGANVTVPHKIEAYRLCELRDGAAQAIGAVNTVWLDGGKLAGSNTDAYGFTANLDSESPGWDRGGPAVVIGAGGARCSRCGKLRTLRIKWEKRKSTFRRAKCWPICCSNFTSPSKLCRSMRSP